MYLFFKVRVHSLMEVEGCGEEENKEGGKTVLAKHFAFKDNAISNKKNKIK